MATRNPQLLPCSSCVETSSPWPALARAAADAAGGLAQAHPDFSFQIADVVLHLDLATAAAATAAAAADAAAKAGPPERGAHKAAGGSPPARTRGGGAAGSRGDAAADGWSAQAAAIAAFAEPTAGVVGEVVALRAGCLLVHWGDGSESLVGPDKVRGLDLGSRPEPALLKLMVALRAGCLLVHWGDDSESSPGRARQGTPVWLLAPGSLPITGMLKLVVALRAGCLPCTVAAAASR